MAAIDTESKTRGDSSPKRKVRDDIKDKRERVAGSKEREASDQSEGCSLLTCIEDVRVGMKLEAKDTYGKWYAAKVIEVEEDDEEVLVHFDKWNSRYDEYIKVNTGRLRTALASPSESSSQPKDNGDSKKVLKIGDLVQAKWEDRRMYFGKVLKVHRDEVDILYDDGVKYKAPTSAVRRRRHLSRSNLSRNSYNESDSNQTPNLRTLRAQKRLRSEESVLHASLSSPPSSPVFLPTKKHRVRCVDSDSTDSDESLYCLKSPQVQEHPLPKSNSDRGKGVRKKRESKCSLSTSSDSESSGVQGLNKKTKRSNDDTREPYRLRHVSQQLVKLSPVKELGDPVSSDSKECTGDTPLVSPISSVENSNIGTEIQADDGVPPANRDLCQISTSGSTHPETPNSKINVGITKINDDIAEAHSVSNSSSRKDSAVASRTRAHTKFGCSAVPKKVEPKKTVKVAPKEMVIVLDHNEFKCKATGCNKSFRKETLLQSHVKHYHTDIVKSIKRQRLASGPSPKSQEESEKRTESSSSPHQRSQSPPVVVPLLPLEQAQKGAKGVSSSKLSPKQTPANRVTKNSPKSKSKDNKEIVKTEKSYDMPCYVQPDETGKTAISQPRAAVKLESTIPSLGVVRQKHAKEVAASIKSNKKALGNSYATMFSVVGPPLKVPLIDIKALPRESLFLPSQRQANIEASSFSREDDELINDNNMLSEVLESRGSSSRPSVCRRVLYHEDDDDVVHCVCGDLTDEGFMIQCEQCLCWQHGDCIRLTKDTLPECYVCCFCTNPPGRRNRLKYQFDREWFGEGQLSNLLGAPRFAHSSAVKQSHQLTDRLYQLKKMLHSSKVKLHAASRVNHPYLRQWAKECSHLEKSDIVSYLIAALVPISYYSNDAEASNDTEASLQVQVNHETLNTPQKVDGTLKERVEVLSGNRSFGLKVMDVAQGHSDTMQNGTKGSSDRNYSSVHDDAETALGSVHIDTLISSTGLLVPARKSLSSEGSLESRLNTQTLKLTPLPPLKTEHLQQLTTEILKQSIQLSVSKHSVSTRESATSPTFKDDCSSSNTLSVSVSADEDIPEKFQSKLKTESQEVLNDEFGVQELSVFALESDKSTPPQLNNVSPQSLTLPSSSLFAQSTPASLNLTKPILMTSSAILSGTGEQSKTTVCSGNSSASTIHSSSTPLLTVFPSRANQSLTDINSNPSNATSVIPSTMESVSLGEFAEAFMQGDTTNWFQRMKLLDHIEKVQEKVSMWMDMLDRQLEEFPVDDDDTEDIKDVLNAVQTTMNQLREFQQMTS